MSYSNPNLFQTRNVHISFAVDLFESVDRLGNGLEKLRVDLSFGPSDLQGEGPPIAQHPHIDVFSTTTVKRTRLTAGAFVEEERDDLLYGKTTLAILVIDQRLVH
jgi:hypothetical protein